ncbi:dimeric dUTPase (all-alpha-NTP-PPase superfamily) [Bacillus niacini]|jgi:dimeric dUTPase (all-alpha-NTP-PPase superfamily)|uniref:Dimeric dUTPase (All-alpha-NTP-PPase superfamily) n=1 Tax=Neobacillus niacini TaxID=86668 RepID=A0A852TJ46_9BACI|nr:dUTP diphosphatase [Neobacillus niacini]NYE07746.1 dimeric dUTPase (all-alpha-NTP-PPase superfamily) [Neobacillus niacini]
MQLEKLFKMQRGLDQHIEEKHGLQNEDLFDRKVLALLVELGELANETRCFKFWSIKPSSEKSVVLEEYVDGIHFILSLGIECGFQNLDYTLDIEPSAASTTEQFLLIYQVVNKFRDTKSESDFKTLLQSYLQLGTLLGISYEEMEKAYFTKNEVNYQRQQNNY